MHSTLTLQSIKVPGRDPRMLLEVCSFDALHAGFSARQVSLYVLPQNDQLLLSPQAGQATFDATKKDIPIASSCAAILRKPLLWLRNIATTLPLTNHIPVYQRLLAV